MSYDFIPSHARDRQRCKVWEKLHSNTYKAWGVTVLPMACYISPPILWGCQLADSYSLSYTGSSSFIWLICLCLQKVLFQLTIIFCRESAFSHTNQMTTVLAMVKTPYGCEEKTECTPPKVQTSHKPIQALDCF